MIKAHQSERFFVRSKKCEKAYSCLEAILEKANTKGVNDMQNEQSTKLRLLTLCKELNELASSKQINSNKEDLLYYLDLLSSTMSSLLVENCSLDYCEASIQAILKHINATKNENSNSYNLFVEENNSPYMGLKNKTHKK